MTTAQQPGLFGEDVPSLSSLLRPSLPPAALHGLPGRVACELADTAGVDPAAVLVAFLTMFGNVLGAQPHAEFGGAAHPGRLFALIVGDAATGRKGTAYEAVEGLFRVADPDWADSRLMFGLQSAEALIDRVADGSGDPRLMVVETEFGRLVKVMQRTGNLSAQLRNAWDGRTLQRALKDRSRSQEAKSAHVSLLAMITPGELLRLHRQMREAGGLESRILYCYSAPAAPRDVSPFRTGGTHPGWLAVAVREAVSASRAAVMARTDPVSAYLCTERGIQPHVVLGVDHDVAAGWLGAVRPRMPIADTALGPFFSRAETHLIRLAACYSLADQAPAITSEHVDAALALWTYCAHSAERVFGIPVGDLAPRVSPAHAAKVLRYLYDSYPGWVSRDEVHSRALGRNVPAASVEAVLASLGARDLAEERTTPTGGRPRTEYRLRMVSA